MIVQNDSGADVSLRWNRYISTYMVDVMANGKVVSSTPLRVGGQHFAPEVSAVTIVPYGECVRTDCDITLSESSFFSGCGVDS